MFFTSCALFCALFQFPAPDAPPASTVLHRPAGDGLLALRELDGDGRLDLVLLRPSGFGVRFQRDDGCFPADQDTQRPWPAAHLAWDLVDLDRDRRFELVTLSGEGRVVAWRVGEDRELDEGTLLLESRSYLPLGVGQMRFARDIDGDSLADFVLPAGGTFRIHLQGPAGHWNEPIEIEYDAEVDYQVGDPSKLDGRFGQSLRIPWFSLEDVDGDGLGDLVSRTEECVDFHLARPELAATPTWSLDLAALEESGRRSADLDLDDLLSNIDLGVEWELADIDGRAPRDLLVQVGGTLKVWLGGSVTGTARSPDQVLKLSGNVLHFFTRDVQGDALPDLQLVRGEKVSLGRVLRWLILPGSLDFDLFTYRNEGGAFSRKPTKTNTVELEIPRLLSVLDDLEEFGDEIDLQRKIPATRAALDSDGVMDDVVDVQGGEVLFFADCALSVDERYESLEKGDVEAVVERFVLEDVDAMEDGETKTIDLGEVRGWSWSAGSVLRAACEGREPKLRLAAPTAEGDFHVRALDLNSDGRDDVVLWVKLPDESFLVQLIVFPTAPR